MLITIIILVSTPDHVVIAGIYNYLPPLLHIPFAHSKFD